jgi:hypothetical protein
MSRKIRITFSQVMAILALMSILLSVVGTAWMSHQPAPAVAPEIMPLMS